MKNKQFSTLVGKAAGLVAAASVGTLAVAFDANAVPVLLFQDEDSFTDELTELIAMPELIVDQLAAVPAGFTITEVQVMLSGTLSSQGTVTNLAAQTQSFTALSFAFQYDLVPQSDSPPLQTLQLAPLFGGGTGIIGSQDYTLDPNESAPFGPFEESAMTTQSITNAGEIASLIGPGTVTFDPFTTIFTTFQGGGGNLAADIATLADATLTIKYFGEANPNEVVPEPSTLLGLGLVAGLGLFSKKGLSKKS